MLRLLASPRHIGRVVRSANWKSLGTASLKSISVVTQRSGASGSIRAGGVPMLSCPNAAHPLLFASMASSVEHVPDRAVGAVEIKQSRGERPVGDSHHLAEQHRMAADVGEAGNAAIEADDRAFEQQRATFAAKPVRCSEPLVDRRLAPEEIGKALMLGRQ